MGDQVIITWDRACGLLSGPGRGVLLGVAADREHRVVLVVARSDGNVVTVPYHEASHNVPAKPRKPTYNHERETT